MRSWRRSAVCSGVALLLFAAAAVYGYAAAPDPGPAIRPEVQREVLRDLATESPRAAFSRIAQHNLAQTLLLLVGGVLTLGVFSTFYSVRTGVYLGSLIAKLASALAGDEVTAFLLPHALIEIPALCIAASVGLSVGAHVTAAVRAGSTLFPAKHRCRELARVAALSVVLIVVAAVIESYVTPRVVLWRLR